MVYFKRNLYADAWKKYQANNSTSPFDVGAGVRVGIEVECGDYLSAFLYAPVLFHNLTTNHDPVKRYIKTEVI